MQLKTGAQRSSREPQCNTFWELVVELNIADLCMCRVLFFTINNIAHSFNYSCLGNNYILKTLPIGKKDIITYKNVYIAGGLADSSKYEICTCSVQQFVDLNIQVLTIIKTLTLSLTCSFHYTKVLLNCYIFLVAGGPREAHSACSSLRSCFSVAPSANALLKNIICLKCPNKET